jgi:hypothetical protein
VRSQIWCYFAEEAFTLLECSGFQLKASLWFADFEKINAEVVVVLFSGQQFGEALLCMFM